MNTNDKIDGLIHKYYQGESSPAEEKLLRLLLKNDVSNNYFVEKQLFGFYESQSAKNELNDDFDMKVLNNISITEKPEKTKFYKFITKSGFYISTAAAVLIIGFFGYFYFSNYLNKSGTIITNENFAANKQLAVKETEKAFQLISENLNKANSGLMKLKYINKYSDNQNIKN